MIYMTRFHRMFYDFLISLELICRFTQIIYKPTVFNIGYFFDSQLFLISFQKKLYHAFFNTLSQSTKN